MKSFDQLFSLVSALCLVAWLIAIVPAAIGHARSIGSLSFDDARHTALTVAAMVAFGTFWCLLAVLAKLHFSDWLAAKRQRQATR